MDLKVKRALPVLVIVGISLGWVAWWARNNWYFASDDYGALEYVTKFSWWGMVWRAYTTGDPWGFNKFLGYWAIKVFWGMFGVNWRYWLTGMYVANLINLLLLYFLVKRLTGSKLWGVVAALLLGKFYLNWVSNLHELVAGTGILVGTIGWIGINKQLVDVRYPIRKRLIWYGVAVGGYIAAMAAKEVAILLPVFWLGIALNSGLGFGASFKKLIRVVWPGLIFAGWYVAREKFLLGVPGDHPYLISFSWEVFWQSARFYGKEIFGGGEWVQLGKMGLLALLSGTDKRRLILLGGFVTSMLPVMFFPNRREVYYVYLPMIYMATYVSIVGAALTERFSNKRRNQTDKNRWLAGIGVLLLTVWIFGGRSILPKFARVVFANRQKDEVEAVVSRVGEVIVNRDSNDFPVEVTVSRVPVGRDGKLLLDSGDLTLFLPKRLGAMYRFVGDSDNGKVTIYKR